MNAKGKAYKPASKGLEKATIARFALKAGARAESYTFATSRNRPPEGIDGLLSEELSTLQAAKLEFVNANTSKWQDRNSIIAAPLGAEMFLHNERCSVMLGAPRFYHDVLKHPHEDAHGRSVPPDTTIRFAYSMEAHAAAKVLTGRMARSLLRRQHAASIIGRNYLGYLRLRLFREECRRKTAAIRKIQFFCRKRLERTRQRQRRTALRLLCCITLQCFFRMALARRRVQRHRHKRIYRAARYIQRFIAWCPVERRRQRGRRRRADVHAVRIQSLVRGRQCRRRLRPATFPFWRLVRSGGFEAHMLRVVLQRRVRVHNLDVPVSWAYDMSDFKVRVRVRVGV